MEQPIVYYTPTIAPSGMVFYTGSRYPGWKNNLFVSALGGQQLRRLEISGDKVTHQEQVFNQFGRVHDVIIGPDGYLYVTLQVPGQVLSQSTPGMRSSPGLEDIWQLHWSYNAGIELNSAGVFIANIDDPATIAGVLSTL